ncbi:MAG: hypothetical protein ACRCWQ_06595 [Bacilli bacterium]
MDYWQQKAIQSELELTRLELEQKLMQSTLIPQILEAELFDVNVALDKLRNGTYGLDENTGQRLDSDLLAIVPTARTYEDLSVASVRRWL